MWDVDVGRGGVRYLGNQGERGLGGKGGGSINSLVHESEKVPSGSCPFDRLYLPIYNTT